MKTMEPSILNRIGVKLLQAQQELDELTVQLALGKAEAHDKFEEVKLEFRMKVAEFRNQVREMRDMIKPEVLQKLDELELKLALGRAESKEVYQEQKQKIKLALANLEHEWNQGIHKVDTDFFIHEAEKFRLKLDILRLRFELKAFQVKDSYRSTTINVKRELEKIATRVQQKLHMGTRYADFKDELSLAYEHLKKAVHELV